MIGQSSAPRPEGAEQLVSTPATSCYQPFRSGSKQAPNVTHPTAKQEAAINALKSFDEVEVFAWLTLLRSLQPGIQIHASRNNGPGCLTSQQLDAIVTLQRCHNDNVSSWLDSVSLADNDNKQQFSLSSKRSASKRSSPLHTRQNSAKSSHRSSTSSYRPSSLYTNFSSKSTPRSSLGNNSLLFDVPEGEPGDEEPGHTHWCTHSEHPKSIRTCDAWKRHEREHEVVYRCMPFGPVVNTAAGPECAFCGIWDPSPSHLQEHHVFACTGSSRKPLMLSRRSNLAKHLTIHGIHGERANALATKWRCDSNKKAFSCGFCVRLFDTVTDRSSHIDNEHWKHGQDMSEWSMTNVIRGLLLHPEVKPVWERYLAMDLTFYNSRLRWELPKAEGLQIRLEMVEENATDLATAAWQLCTYDTEEPCQGGSTATALPREEQMGSNGFPSYRQHMISTGLLPGTSPTQGVSPMNGQQRVLTSQYQSSPPGQILTPPIIDSSHWRSNQSRVLEASSMNEQSSRNLSIQPISSITNSGDEFHINSTMPTPLNNDFLVDYQTHIRNHLTTSGLSLVAQLPPSGQGYPFALADVGRQQSLSNSWSSGMERPGHSTAQSSRIGDSSRKPSEKPLPPLPDPCESYGSEPRARSPMDTESE